LAEILVGGADADQVSTEVHSDSLFGQGLPTDQSLELSREQRDDPLTELVRFHQGDSEVVEREASRDESSVVPKTLRIGRSAKE
jgi:hypothetical protein